MKMQLLFVLTTIFGCMLAPSVEALTTFGKTNPQSSNQNPQPSPTPVGKARECRLESDCAAIQNTTCSSDPRDGKTRCLCSDHTAPVNGACTNLFKAIRALCNDNWECMEGAHCVQFNATTPGKRCYCREGYVEERFMCSGSSPILRISLFVLWMAAASGNWYHV